MTFIITQVSGKKDYWMHIFWMPGVPVVLKPVMAIIELIGLFVKPFFTNDSFVREYACGPRSVNEYHWFDLRLWKMDYFASVFWFNPCFVLVGAVGGSATGIYFYHVGCIVFLALQWKNMTTIKIEY